ncbi:hypothetical protein EIB18_16965 [Caulobacter vibrioides]|uniref:Uncharacterized protein n=1 Tax=Caulobacter vibrioides (strain NA1000 / CB15N) TaxID=565050 RepID=A0A0H3CB97_CAUVN|nr:hypothetical protein [Caulobacter vibrioides]YP_002518679.1 hypothetical protein CCNA_03307 [Caulobacter vibrioides NA1000]QBQ57351.1 hypothetical protein EUX21_03195 [synthetic Caulobacter sp. 'ethensis']ACL96771.1 hypothetical protein CCNA_03307 [Caulobacter vibrioides NA1000]ATC26086.1 hypothetical protein CA608_16870 [Caulobacter vibrioides]ATC30028.1 hypothetical protein CA607_17220 [Caulobacter vibrioides]AZH14226.1 hypothetical protein EIB18_16965 [Caulobacter vibrioides]
MCLSAGALQVLVFVFRLFKARLRDPINTKLAGAREAHRRVQDPFGPESPEGTQAHQDGRERPPRKRARYLLAKWSSVNRLFPRRLTPS